jgi:hypothetical protein
VREEGRHQIVELADIGDAHVFRALIKHPDPRTQLGKPLARGG